MADLHDLAAAYVMDALSADERNEFARHLRTCVSCQLDVTKLSEPVEAMAVSLEEGPSRALRPAVLEEIAITSQIGSSGNVVALPRRHRAATWALGVAAVLLAVVAGAIFLQLRDARIIQSIVEATDVETVTLAGDGFEARFTYSAQEGRGLFVSGSLPDVSSEETYQLWLIDPDGATPAGLLRPRDGSASILVADVRAGVTLGLTIEPAGGSPAPTTDVLLQAPL